MYRREILTIPGVDIIVQLIVFWSKALLRHPHARSSLEDMTTDTAFQRYIPDSHPDNLASPNEIRRHILCTGLYSYPGGIASDNLLTVLLRSSLSHPHSGASRQGHQRRGDQPGRTTLPFPLRFGPSSNSSSQFTLLTIPMKVTSHLDKYPNADVLWCQVRPSQRNHPGFLFTLLQEEPLNNGAWTYVAPRILTAANETQHHKGKYPLYAGREPTSSVATGSKVCNSPSTPVESQIILSRRLYIRNRLRTF